MTSQNLLTQHLYFSFTLIKLCQFFKVNVCCNLLYVHIYVCIFIIYCICYVWTCIVETSVSDFTCIC